MTKLADIVRNRHEDILHLWTDEAQRAASARGLARPVFQNLMPAYLATFGEAATTPAAAGHRRRLLDSHLESRLRQGFDLAEIVEEIGILGRCVTQMWSAAPAADVPEAREIEALHAELQAASALAAETFAGHMQHDQQAEKRYTRLLEDVAREALQPGATRLADRLKELLSIVLEAMGAQTAALLLQDGPLSTPGALVTAASQGAPNGELERHLNSLDPSSLVGRVARQEEPTEVRDVSTTELEVDETLRRSGIHSLLGIRLMPRDRLLGVLYIGLTESRSFTSREIGRLEMLAARLTVHLDNARLFLELEDTIGALQAEREVRERFVSLLAHDLRGPLTAVSGAAQVLSSFARLPAPHSDLPAVILRNVGRADQMIRDLLDANQVNAGERLPLRLAECDLTGVATDVVAEMVAAQGDRFVLNAAPSVRGVWDAEQLRRALWNLATNAVKYGDARSPITISVQPHEDGATLSVHNLGHAIAAADQARLFEPFARTRRAQTGKAKGWGLGLTLVRGCAEAHGGAVRVQSDAVEGTLFVLTLPWDSRPFQPERPDGEREATPVSSP